MPLSKYDKHFGGKKGAAKKAKKAMREHYGEEKGERVFYATKNKRAHSSDEAADALERREKKGRG